VKLHGSSGDFDYEQISWEEALEDLRPPGRLARESESER
jgi:hypothetical protein